MSKHVLFGTSAWGLGHATRDLVLMRRLAGEGPAVQAGLATMRDYVQIGRAHV